MVNVA